jgi:hypothetical protein
VRWGNLGAADSTSPHTALRSTLTISRSKTRRGGMNPIEQVLCERGFDLFVGRPHDLVSGGQEEGEQCGFPTILSRAEIW